MDQPAAARAPRAKQGEPLPRITALDGVRGLAILLVMIHHFTFLPKGTLLDTAVHGVSKLGWTGVDLFFVLSGYLITTILIEYRGDGKYFSAFYARRVLRILPVYYLVLALTLFVLPRFVNLGVIGGSSLWYWLHVSNLYIAFHQFSHKSLDIAWSLAIEEQFYLLWPLVVSLTPKRLLGRVCLAVFAGSALLRLGLGLLGAPWNMTYVLTPCRLDGLALGAFLACLPAETLRGSHKIAAWVAGAAGIVVIATVGVTRSTHMEGRVGPAVGYAALALLWAAVLVLALSVPRVGRLFSMKPLLVLGKYSYGLYLFHMPITYLVRDRLFGPDRWPRVLGSALVGQLLFHALVGSLSLALAWLSWRLLEEPILRLKKHFRYARM